MSVMRCTLYRRKILNDEENMEIVKVDKHAGIELIKILGLELKCKYCDVEITEENFGGMFSKPSRVCCDNLLCLSEAIDKNNERKEE